MRVLTPQKQAEWLAYFDSQLSRPGLSQVALDNLAVRRRLVAEQSRIGTAAEARRALGLVAAPRLYSSNAPGGSVMGAGAGSAAVAPVAVAGAAASDPTTLKEAIAAGVEEHPALAIGGAAAAGLIAGGVAGAAIGAAVARRPRSRSRTSRRKAGTSRRRGRRVSSSRRDGPRKTRKTRNRRGGAVRDRYKGRKVYRTKRGQPYILLRNGQARFVRA